MHTFLTFGSEACFSFLLDAQIFPHERILVSQDFRLTGQIFLRDFLKQIQESCSRVLIRQPGSACVSSSSFPNAGGEIIDSEDWMKKDSVM